MTSPEDFSAANRETLDEIIREAESFLTAQLSSGLAANGRAMSLTGFLATGTIVLAGAAVNLLMSANQHFALGIICAGISITFLASMWFAISAASPTRFWFVGNSPRSWVSDLKAGKSTTTSLAEMASFYADMIADNNECMALSDSRLVFAMRLAWTALFVGAVLIVVSWEAGVL